MENKKNLKGIPPSIIDMNLAIYGEFDPDMPFIPKEKINEIWEATRPKIDEIKGQVIIFGTGGEINEGTKGI